MAYRQLCAVTFLALGMVVSACGGSTASGESGGSSETQPPTNGDQAPTSSTTDQAPSNSDQAPTNSDAPPGSSNDSAGTGASGNLGQLCQKVCDGVEHVANQCSGQMSLLSGLCSKKVDCKVPVNFPCANELGDALTCFFDNLALICQAATAGDGGGGMGAFPQDPSQSGSAAMCQDAFKKFSTCADANHIDTSTMQQPQPQPQPGGGCVPGVSCDGCGSDLGKCICEANGDQTKATACLTP